MRKDSPISLELADESDDDAIEISNLPSSMTGVSGIILISTMMRKHVPRVKYSLEAGREGFSVTISDKPTVISNSLSKTVLDEMSPLVVEWIVLNKDALLDYCNNGDAWDDDFSSSFKRSLRRICK